MYYIGLYRGFGLNATWIGNVCSKGTNDCRIFTSFEAADDFRKSSKFQSGVHGRVCGG